MDAAEGRSARAVSEGRRRNSFFENNKQASNDDEINQFSGEETKFLLSLVFFG